MTMANGRITVRKAQAGDVAALKQALRETFEGTWLPHVTQASARRYVETDTFNERTRNVYKAVGYIRKRPLSR
jgi:hypothetical protein